MKDETYLGDGVYAAHDGSNIWIWTNNGVEKGKPIGLESEVLDALTAYRTAMLEKSRMARRAYLGEDEQPEDAV